jgi:hypothetical protein
MIVSEYQTGEIIIYDISQIPAVELDRINTGLNSLQGIKIGPSGRIWFVDQNTDGVYKIEAAGLGLDENQIEALMAPNPTSGELTVLLNSDVTGTIEVRNLQGQLVSTEEISGNEKTIQIDAGSGMYFVSVIANGYSVITEKVIVE